MTNPTSPRMPAFDTGPLSWVIGEIRDALGRSGTALRDAAGRNPEAQPTLLLHAKTHLHQADGALQLVDVEGAAVLGGAAEKLIDAFKDGRVACTPDTVKVVQDAYQALVEYLDELLAGSPQQPARLFPYYRDLQEKLGVERIHPSDLLPASLGKGVALHAPVPAPLDGTAPDIAACRARFEKALLPYLKSGEARHADGMRDALAPIAASQEEPRARLFWQALHAFAGVVADGQLESDLYVKQLLGQVNLQLRRLSQGQGGTPDAMLRDALFFVAAAEGAATEPNPDAQRLRQACGLDGLVPHDYAARRYGRIDQATLQEAREALARTKSDWDRIATEGDLGVKDDFTEQLSRLAGASEKLGAPALAQLMRELGRAATDAMQAGRSKDFGLEMATAMLFVENGLAQLRQLPEDFAEDAEAVGARLLALAAGETPPDAPQWQGELARQIQQGQTVAVLAGEIKAGLRQVEKLLDDYYDDPARRDVLAQAEPVLHGLLGALSILDQEQAVQAVRHVAGEVRALGRSDGDVSAQSSVLHNIAQNIGALGFFTDLLAQDSEVAKGRFTFDLEKRLLRELPFEFVEAAPGFAPGSAATEEVPEQPQEATIESELLEIFILEAREVLGFVAEALPQAESNPASQETLTLLRRSFHTLKGSGRMVSLDSFAEAAAAVERVMNLWLAEARSATPELLALLRQAHAELSAWVADLVASGSSTRDNATIVAAAARVQEGGAPVPDAMPEPVAEDIPVPVLEDILEPEPELVTEPEPAPGPEPLPDTKRIGGLEIPLGLYTIYLDETGNLVQLLAQDFDTWHAEPERRASPEALKAAHTLAGTSSTVGYAALRDVAHALELVLEKLAAPGPTLDDDGRALLDATLSRVRTMLQVFALGELAPAQPELIAQLDTLLARLASQQAASVYGEVDPALAHKLDALFATAYGEILASPPAEPALARHDEQEQARAVSEIDDLFDSFLDDPFAAPALDQAAPAQPGPASHPLFVPVTPDEAVLDAAPEGVAPAFESEPLQEALHAPISPAVPEPAPATSDSVLATGPVFTDELDPDLLPVFLEEGADLFPQIGKGLRQWQQNPQDHAVAQGLQRALHTVKGSARMAGAMRLGQHTHELETQIENMVHAGTSTPAAFDELLANYDQALLLFEQLQQPSGPAAPPVPASAAAEQPGSRAPLVRVRADVLDRVVNQAGEVSITRSRLENQVGSLKGALSDFSENLDRLRRQMREIEMQAESQIASTLSIAGEQKFDPLEFDRFTRLQELTRMMAESVNDVEAFHESLSRTVDSASEDLAAQSRMTRDLQRDLMRVRMVPFANLSERLFRVARQTAKELEKRVNLDIRGGSVEIDRSVLEQMAAPFEHLLRNAIVHGIEGRTARIAAGKAETGEVLVQVSQHGNEVAIVFSDDGAGLDLERIRAKARDLGLLKPGQSVLDQEAAELIFEPGFSTADTLTELAGRGVGMDVVRSEAQALGGRVLVSTEPGKGTRFSIHLPLTLAVAQVVLVASGGRTYALPSTLVEQVLQVRDTELAAAEASGSIAVAGQSHALHSLDVLLGEGNGTAPQRLNPVLVVHGAGGRIALRVDEVLGNREVVVKNIGPQLSKVPGIAGATVLGTGEIVLILDPVVLAQRPMAPTAGNLEEAQPEQRPVIMVVDDSITVRRVTQRMLEREGYRVMLAKDGVDALEQIEQLRPDLMLVDIEMPRMDGFDLTREVRNNERTRSIPIIMITSRTADKHRNVALGLGVNAYFGKPYQEPVLVAAIESLLE
ncbi:Hpt domain-containing protein [Massilia sp. BSC265]|uniref:hybrid sensor histidine kinase/response regulator n=1 Tax=Massilia sp. BSC265 TaxID=1549812 RepID=UPI0004E97734|nr:Hpt domain-containing protein [Massilia sp. BSC265]KFI06276.1 chemotaxis protein CheA [Massilia sp. BSC265]